MSDLISRQDAIALVIKAIHGTDNKEIQEYLFDGLRKQMWSLPSADRPTVDKEYLIDLIQEAVYDGEACAKLMDMVDRPTGRWIRVGYDIYECSLCHQNVMTKDIDCYSYCHRCGAKMLGEDGEA